MLEYFKSMMSNISGGYAELRFQQISRTTIIARNSKVDEIIKDSETGGALRFFSSTGVGFATFNNPDDLQKVIEKAKEASRLSRNPVKLKDAPAIKDSYEPSPETLIKNIPLEEKIDLIERYSKIVGSHEKISQVEIQYFEKDLVNYFFSNDGHEIVEHRPYLIMTMSVTATDGSIIQTRHKAWGGQKGFKLLKNREQEIEEMVKTAVDLLKAEPVSGGTYNVILDPAIAGTFIHEAFGHLSEADMIYKNPIMLEKMKIGKRFGKDLLNVVDDGTIEGEYGFYVYDDEGVKSTKTYLIKNGIFNSRLHSRETAELLNNELTGNARAVNYTFQPLVRMSITYIEPGNATFEEMLERVGNGLYVVGASGGETANEMFTFSAQFAYEIKNGKLGRLIRDVTLSGNVFETLMNIEMIGNDLEFQSGHCGKMFQMPLPVSTGAPHVMIKNIIVGGR